MYQDFQGVFASLNDPEMLLIRTLFYEYDDILRQRSLNFMSRAAIALSDSNAVWGKWDPLTRTIWLSRNLIYKHSWFHVLGVMRHEMAHQYVDEIMENDNRVPIRPPHGEKFQEACAILGVPDVFARATSCLQQNNLDWRLQPIDSRESQLLEKIRKLLSLANSSNEHEAVLAMNKVRELYAKYHLDSPELKRAEFFHLIFPLNRKRIQSYEWRMASLLINHFFVKVIAGNMFDIKKQTYMKVFEIIGTRENVLMAEYVYNFLRLQVEQLVEGHFDKQATKLPRARVGRNSYRLGVLAGFSQKLTELETTKKEHGSSKNSSSDAASSVAKALIAFHSDPKLKNYIAKIYPRLVSTQSSHSIDRSTFSAGMSQGRKLTLRRAIITSDGNQGKLLSGS